MIRGPDLEIIRFSCQDIDNLLTLQPERLDSLAFGALLLDRNGIIVKYNQAQGLIWGRQPAEMIGRDFFAAVAQCCRNTPVQFNYQAFLRSGHVDTLLEHDLLYGNKMITVKIHIKSQADGQRCWIFTKWVSTHDNVIPANTPFAARHLSSMAAVG